MREVGDGDLTEDEDVVTRVQSDPSVITADATVEAGASLDRFLVIEERGRGGMGLVLRAYDPKLAREVALKVVRTSSLGDDSRARLVREARVMAQLNHPNVVSVYDVILDLADGGVMLVMELVDGPTLQRWLGDETHSWTEALALFIQCGRALAVAHAAGLMHRDFKPANVVLDARGTPKVTDFGIARLQGGTDSLDPSMSARASNESIDIEITNVGLVMGTPAYMAPEQHQTADANSLGVAADQYSFCVALWEALAGSRPFRGSGVALLQAKMEGPPPWPSGTHIPRGVAEAVRRGLHPRPSQRWPSMKSLVAELENALDPSRTRRTVAAVGIVSAIAAGTAYIVNTQTAPCTDAGTRLDDVWQEDVPARIDAAFSGSALSYAQGIGIRVREGLEHYAETWRRDSIDACRATNVEHVHSSAVLDLRMACLEQAKSELAAAVALLSAGDEDVLARGHELVDGLPPLERCSDIAALQADIPPPPADLRERVAALREELVTVSALSRAQRYEEAQKILERLRVESRDLEYRPLHNEIALRSGLLADAQGDYEEALETLRGLLADAIRLGQWWVAARASLKLVHVAGIRLSQFDAAAAYAETAAGLLPRAGLAKKEGPRLLISRSKIARVQNDYDKALVLAQQALEQIDVETNGAVEEAFAHINLADVLRVRDEFDRAEAEQVYAVEALEKALDPKHPMVGYARNNLGSVYLEQDRLEDAAREYEAAFEIRRDALGPDHPTVLDSRNNLALILHYQERDAEALEILKELRVAYAAKRGEDSGDVARTELNMSTMQAALGRHEEALEHARVAARIWSASHGESNLRPLGARAMVAEMQRRLEQLEEAEASYRDTIELCRANPAAIGLQLDLAGQLAALLNVRGRYEDARVVIDEALEAESDGKQEEERSKLQLERGHALHRLGQSEAAVTALRTGIAGLEHSTDMEPTLARAHQMLARALWQTDLEAARRSAETALELYRGLEDKDAVREVGAWLANPAG